MWWTSNIWCQFVVSLAKEVCSQTCTVNLIAWKSSERLLFQCVPSMVSQVASISLEQLTGVRKILFAPGKSTQPNVTHHRPPDVFGNDPLVKFGRGWTERNQKWSLWCPSTACTRYLYRSSTQSLTAQLEVSRALGEIKGRVMNKVPGLWDGEHRGDCPLVLYKTPLLSVSRKELSAHFPSQLAIASLKPLHGMLPEAKQRSEVWVPFICC